MAFSSSTRALLVAAILLAMSSVALSQFFGGFFAHQQPQAAALGGAANTRDPRGNTGPVVFPPSAPGTETSGVRVGASGFGFVPPNQPRAAHSPFGAYNLWG